MQPMVNSSRSQDVSAHIQARSSPSTEEARSTGSIFDGFTSEKNQSDDISFSDFVSEGDLQDRSAGAASSPNVEQTCALPCSDAGDVCISDLELGTSGESCEKVPHGDKCGAIHTSRDVCKFPEGHGTEASAVVRTGFVTGNQRVISVRKTSLEKASLDVCEEERSRTSRKRRSDVCSDISELYENRDKVSRGCGGSEGTKGCGTNLNAKEAAGWLAGAQGREERYIERMKEIFLEVSTIFCGENKKWVFEQFRWTWLSLFSRGKIVESAAACIAEQMRARKRREYSVLRRIVEGDDISWRYMILLVTKVQKNRMEVFDGAYSVSCAFDEELGAKIGRGEISVLTKLRVFGAKLILNRPMSIFDVDCDVLYLFSNSVGTAGRRRTLGYQRKSSFTVPLCSVQRRGGVVSCISVEIKKVLEERIFLKCGNYRKVVDLDRIEHEIDKMDSIARSSSVKLSAEEIVARRYAKVAVRDDSRECVLTWWEPDDVRVGDRYRFIFLRLVETAGDVQLATTKRTHFKRLTG